MLFGGVAAAAAVRTFPFRVFSFPSEIVIPPVGEYSFQLEALKKLSVIYYDKAAIENLKENLIFNDMMEMRESPKSLTMFAYPS